MAVFVLDRTKKPLMPCSEKRARKLLQARRARVHKLVPFTIRLVDRTQAESVLHPIRLQIDPGSKTTGMAILRERTQTGQKQVLHLAELQHRGWQISESLSARRAFRRRRRSAHLRYRAPRFYNRRKPEGWLPPSLRHRIETTMSWVRRLSRWVPLSAISVEVVRFDTQALQNPEIGGVAYQQGELAGYEVREYLLEKWGRKCAYCHATDIPLQIEHIHPKSRGGSDRVSNLTLACEPCNQRKGNSDVREFVKDADCLRRILAHAKAPLKDAAAVNSTRWALYGELRGMGLPVETATGGRTKWNRHRLGIPKTHALDAACVGRVEQIENWNQPTLLIKAAGRGAYQRTRLDSFGFPRGYLLRRKSIHGFQTGDLARAVVPSGKHAGSHQGRIAIRASGSFNLQTPGLVRQSICHKHFRLIQRADGYKYEWGGIPPTPKAMGSLPASV